MKKKSFAVLLVAVAVAAAGWVWWQGRNHGDARTLVLYGNVDIRQISLAFDASGRVVAVRAEEGDHVKAGAVLALLDTRALELQADEARAQVEVRRQALLRLRNGSRPQEIALARDRLAAAQANASRLAQDLTRLQSAAANTQGRGVSAQDLDRARSNLQAARAQAAAQQETLRLAELGPRQEDVAGAQAQLDAAKAQLAFLQYQIDQGELKAPADAVVRSRLLEPGDMATPQRPVFALVLTRHKWVRVYVSETDLGKIRPGMAARVFTDSQPDRPVDGKVGYISSVAEFTPKPVETQALRTSLVYEVRVRVEDNDDALRLGQPVTVRLAIGG